MKKLALLTLLLAAAAFGAEAQEAGPTLPLFALEYGPAVDIPLNGSPQYFSTGEAFDLSLSYRLPGTIFFFSGGLDYAYAPTLSNDSLSLVSGKLGAGARLQLTPLIAVLARADGGYWYGTFDNISGSGSDLYADAGLGVQLAFSPRFSVGIMAQYGNGIFVAVASPSSAAASSPDGITWTGRTLPSSPNWQSVTYGNGTFVAVANGSNATATSPDGIAWTARTLPSSQSWLSVAYGNGAFVAVAASNAAPATSP